MLRREDLVATLTVTRITFEGRTGLADLCHIDGPEKVQSTQRQEKHVQSINIVVENHFLSEALQRFCRLFYHRLRRLSTTA